MKYICYGGYIRSADGDEHYISAAKVQRLYNVNPNDCIYIDSEDEARLKLRGYSKEFIDSAMKLYPRLDGDYTLPEAADNESKMKP